MTTPASTTPTRLNSLGLLVGIVLSAIPAIAFLAGQLADHFVVNADYLLLPEIIGDLTSGGSLDRWVVPYATYLIPDWPMYGLAMALTPSASQAVAAFAFMQSLFLFAGLRRLAKVFDRQRANLIAMVGLAVLVIYAIGNAVPLVYLATAYSHFGTAILLIWALAYTLDWLASPRPRLLGASAVVSALAVLSDRLYILWFLVPAAIALGVMTLRGQLQRRQLLEWLAPHVVLSMLALPVSGLLFTERSEYDLTLGFSEPRAGFNRFIDTLRFVAEYSTTLIPLIVAATLASAWLLRNGRSPGGAPLPRVAIQFLPAFFGIAAVITATAQILMVGDVAPGPRYSLPIIMLPLVLLPALLLPGWTWSTPRQRVLGAVILVPVVFAAAQGGAMVPDIDVDQTPVESACIESVLEDTGSDWGIASYWDARTVETFSNGQLEVAPYNAQLYESHINAGLDGFADRYDFMVSSEIYPGWDLPVGLIDYVAGPPLQRVTCGRWLVSDWGPGGLTLVGLADVGDSLTFDGCIMSSHLAEPADDCSLAVTADETTREFLVYGPYAHISPGTYDVTVDYSSAQPAQTSVGAWDVAIDGLPEGEHLAAGELAGTDGAAASVTTTIVVPEADQSTSIVEWRLITPGSVDVKFSAVTFTRTS